MRYLALASDYDGTLAHDGLVDDDTLRALERLVHSGRKLILVTGRELPDLQSVFPRLDLCERVVAENGALLFNPATREKRILAQRPPEHFLEDLRTRGVSDMSVGDVIVATWHPYERQAIDAIRDSGLELQIIFNKDAVMILPSGVNKMTGLCSALEELKLSRHNVVGIGDAENDHAFVESCECSVAVANAIPSLKERAAFVTQGARGAGVGEIIDKLIESDLSELDVRLTDDCILVGKTEEGNVNLHAHGRNILVCGQSGSGKSTLVTGLLERIFHFRGPAGKMDLRAQNLTMFIQLAEGIDAETWLFHLKRGDYSNWLRHALKDAELAHEIENIEKDATLPDRESRQRIKNALLAKYTAPA